MKLGNPLKILSIFLGLLGTMNSFVMVTYLISTNIALSSFLKPELQFQGYLGSSIAIACTVLMVFGTYYVLRQQMLKGGVINLAAGAILYSAYIYFAFIADPRILNWLEPTGHFLFIPPLLSGLISTMLQKHGPETQIAT